MTGWHLVEVRRVLALIMGGFALMGWAYLSIILRGENPVTEDLFGPAVYAIPGWFWAVYQGAFGTMAATGAAVGGAGGAKMAAVGSSALALEFGLFAAIAGEAAQGTIIVIGSAFVTLPGAIVCALIAAQGVRDGRN
jgi:hypothetical protein